MSELRTEGTLVVALTADDQATIAHHLEFQRQLALPLEWLSAAATRAREPRLAGKIAGALFSPEDHQVDNRKLALALRIAAERAGVDIREHQPVKELVVQGGQARGVVLDDGTSVPADVVVLAAGAWSRGIDGLPPTGGRRCARSRARCWRCAWIRRRRFFRTCCGRRASIWCRGVTAGSSSAQRSRKKASTTRLRPAACSLCWKRVARHSRRRGIAGRRDLGRAPAGQPRRRADPRARAASGLVLCDRTSSQRRFARAGDGGRDGAADPRRCRRAGHQALRSRALSAGARG